MFSNQQNGTDYSTALAERNELNYATQQGNEMKHGFVIMWRWTAIILGWRSCYHQYIPDGISSAYRAGASTRFMSTSTSTNTSNMCESQYEYEYLIIIRVQVRAWVLVDEYEYEYEYRLMIYILYTSSSIAIFSLWKGNPQILVNWDKAPTAHCPDGTKPLPEPMLT